MEEVVHEEVEEVWYKESKGVGVGVGVGLSLKLAAEMSDSCSFLMKV